MRAGLAQVVLDDGDLEPQLDAAMDAVLGDRKWSDAAARAVTATLCTRPVYVLWFDSSPTTQQRSVRALAGEDQLALTRVRRVDGGTLYAIRRTNRSPACNSR